MKRNTSSSVAIGAWAILLSVMLAGSASATLLVGVLTRDGIVIATDSRLNRVTPAGDHQVFSDNAIKLVSVQSRFLVAMCGKSGIGNKEIWRCIEEMEGKFTRTTNIEGFAKKLAKMLSKAYRAEYGEDSKEPSITLMVAGYKDGVGRLVEVLVPAGTTRVLHTTDEPGMVWCGEGGMIIERLILGVDKRVAEDTRWDEEDKKALRQREFFLPLPYVVLEDAIRLAVLAIKTTIEWSEFIKGDATEPELFHPTVGGPIDVAVVTPEGTRWIERKSVLGLKYR